MRLMGRDMTTGTTLSAGGHVVLVVWLLTGWGLSQEPLPLQVTEVSIVSGEEYARLVSATTPQPQTEVGLSPEVPVIENAPAPPETLAEETPAPAPEQQPQAPDTELPPPPAPDAPPPAEVTEEVTEIVTPEASAPPPVPDLDVSLRPAPRAADRVAPEAIAPPPPDVAVAPEVTEEATPQADAPEIVVEEAEAAAPEEATTEIVTEADEPSGAVETSLRPFSRPSRPAPAAEAEEQPDVAEAAPAESPAAAVEDDIAAAVAAAAAEAAAAPASTGAPAANPGPPMSGSERDAFRVAVQGCWNVDIGSEASRVTLVVAFELDREGRVLGNNVELVSATDGSAGAINAAFENARRAIIRCQTAEGYTLPADKYESWRQVRMTFDPSGMRMQ